MEEDPIEILDSVKICLNKAVDNLTELGIHAEDIKGTVAGTVKVPEPDGRGRSAFALSQSILL